MSEVTFIFDAQADGSATLTFSPHSASPKAGLVVLKKNSPVRMLLNTPLGLPDLIESATLTFHDEEGQGWPFAGQDGPTLVWRRGSQPITTTAAQGAWKFGAVLTSRLGRTYTVPDPELHVGDGSDDGVAD